MTFCALVNSSVAVELGALQKAKAASLVAAVPAILPEAVAKSATSVQEVPSYSSVTPCTVPPGLYPPKAIADV